MSAQTCPLEILDYIFLLTIQAPEDRLVLPHLSKYTPWAIRQVASSWRKAAITQRKLWDAVVFEIPEDEGHYECLEPYIRRGIREKTFSKMLALAASIIPPLGPVSIGIQPEQEYIDPEVLSMAIEFFTQKYASRMKALSLRCHLAGLRTFFGLSPHTLRGCEILELTALEDDDLVYFDTDRDCVKASSLLQDITSMRSLVFRGEDFLCSIPDLKLPWEQITNLSIIDNRRYCSYLASEFPYMGPILRACQNLERCEIVASSCIEVDPDDDPSNPSQIIVGKLRFLTLHIKNERWSILDHLCLPSLEEFELICSWVPPTTVARMIKRSSAPLKVLKTSCDQKPHPANCKPILPAFIETLSDAAPSLQVLETDMLLDLPSVRAIASGSWFPYLTTFSCHTNLDPLTFSDVLLPRFGCSDPNGPTSLSQAGSVSYTHNGISKADLDEESKRVRTQYGTRLSLSLVDTLQYTEVELHPRPAAGTLAAEAIAEFSSRMLRRSVSRRDSLETNGDAEDEDEDEEDDEDEDEDEDDYYEMDESDIG